MSRYELFNMIRKLERGADPNIRDEDGNTALMIALLHGSNIEVVRFLLDSGVDPNIRDNNGKTPLTIAILYRGNIEIVRLLLERGADPNNRYNDGRTELMVAVNRGVNIKMIRLLLDNGANVNFRDNNGETALMIALRNKYRDIVKLLERHISSSRIQSRFRGRQMRRKARTRRASQQLQASRLPTGYDVSKLIGKYLSRMPYNPEVAKRIKEEESVQEGIPHDLDIEYESPNLSPRSLPPTPISRSPTLSPLSENNHILHRARLGGGGKDYMNYLETLAQYGGKKKRRKTKKKKTKKKKHKTKK